MSRRKRHRKGRGSGKSAVVLDQTQDEGMGYDLELETDPDLETESESQPESEPETRSELQTESNLKSDAAPTPDSESNDSTKAETTISATEMAGDTSSKPPREARFFAYVVTRGPILAQIWNAFQHPFVNGKTPQETILFCLEERDYKKKGSPVTHRSSCFRMNVTKIEYDGSEDTSKRQSHLIITGQIVIDSPKLPDLPHYIDGTPFRNGITVQVFYNLAARHGSGAIIRLSSHTGNGMYAPFVPGHLEYTPPSSF